MTDLQGRRYDIDWLRVIAIGLLLIYHIAIVFQPWGAIIRFMQNRETLESIWIPMSMLNVWRIPLLFFVSGMGVCFAMKKRTLKRLLMERTKRIPIPFVFGIFCIVPIHIFMWQKFYSQPINYSADPSHLWFLGNIFIYVVIFSPVFYYLKKHANGTINTFLGWLYKHPIGLMAVIIPFVLEAVLVRPEPFELYAMTWHGFYLGGLAFFFGFSFIQNGEAFWMTVLKWKWIYATAGMLLYLVRLIYFELQAPAILVSVESMMWIYALLGLGFQYLNKPSKLLTYLSQGAYPVYIIHMAFIYAATYIILPLDMNAGLKLVLVVLFTFFGSIGTYDLIIRRIGFLRPLFGLKPNQELKSVITTNL